MREEKGSLVWTIGSIHGGTFSSRDIQIAQLGYSKSFRLGKTVEYIHSQEVRTYCRILYPKPTIPSPLSRESKPLRPKEYKHQLFSHNPQISPQRGPASPIELQPTRINVGF